MPITRRQFELGIDETLEVWMKKIHAFLSRNRNQAFTQEEIAEALKEEIVSFQRERRKQPGLNPDTAMLLHQATMQAALSKLIDLFAVDAKQVDSTTYYTYLQDLPELH